jgi:hypothetical protein
MSENAELVGAIASILRMFHLHKYCQKTVGAIAPIARCCSPFNTTLNQSYIHHLTNVLHVSSIENQIDEALL